MLEINGKEFTPDEDLVIQGDEFSACDIEQPAVIRNPFPYYDLMRQKPIQYGVRGYPPGTVQGVDEPIPARGSVAQQISPPGPPTATAPANAAEEVAHCSCSRRVCRRVAALD